VLYVTVAAPRPGALVTDNDAASTARVAACLSVPRSGPPGYLVLSEAGLYQPIWKYDATTLARDLSAHLAYGTGTGAAFWLLARTRRPADRSG
jgi:hypothetical protein